MLCKFIIIKRLNEIEIMYFIFIKCLIITITHGDERYMKYDDCRVNDLCKVIT